MHDFPVWTGLGPVPAAGEGNCYPLWPDNSGQLWTTRVLASNNVDLAAVSNTHTAHCMEETRETDQSLQKCNTLTVTEFSCSTLRLCLLLYVAALSHIFPCVWKRHLKNIEMAVS